MERLTAAAKPLANLGASLGSSIDARQTAAEKTRRQNRAMVADLAGDIYATQQKGNQEYARKQAVGIVEGIFKTKRYKQQKMLVIKNYKIN